MVFSFQDKTFIISRKVEELYTSTKNTEKFGMSHRRPQLWNVIPDSIKSQTTLELIRNGNVNSVHVECLKYLLGGRGSVGWN